MAVVVTDHSFQLIVDSVCFGVELPHHLLAVNGLGVLEFKLALFLLGSKLIYERNLLCNVFVSSICIDTDVVLEIQFVLFNLDCSCVLVHALPLKVKVG